MRPEAPASRCRLPHSIGFRTVDTVTDVTLPIEGSLPSWVTGTYLLNGPAKFETTEQTFTHWFDGFGMVHRFQFDSTAVSYRRRFVESRAYTHATEHGSLGFREFATDPPGGCLSRARSLVAPPTLSDNANVTVANYDGRYVATAESTLPIEFDPETLATVAPVPFEDDLAGQFSCGHPQYDPVADVTLNYLLRIARQSSYTVYRIDGDERVPIATIAVDRPCYMHSFAVTPTYVVLVEFPYELNPFTYRVSDRPFIEQFQWVPERGTRLLVFERDTGRLVAQPRTDGFFALHHVNAFEHSGAVVLDLVAYPDPTVVDSLALESLRGEAPPIPPGRLRRLRLSTAQWRVSSRTLSSTPIERPRIAHGRCATRPYRYVYGVGCSEAGASGFYDQLVKIEIDGTQADWKAPGTYPSEPVFVPDPTRDEEDAGVVLSLVLDSVQHRSFVLVLDGETFRERARIPLDHPVPYPRHGQYYDDV